MSDYTVRIQAQTEEAERKLKRVDDRVVKLEKGASIDISVPSAQQTLNTLQQIGAVATQVAQQTLKISRAANIGPGATLNELEEMFELVTHGAQRAGKAFNALSQAGPANILTSGLRAATSEAVHLSKGIAGIGYEIFGLTQSVNILRGAFSGMFNETIGREVALREALLRTRTTLAATADVSRDGVRIQDPYEALIALEGPMEQVLQNIRRRSLEIAGTTSDAIVQTFGVVAAQIGAVGGSLQDAEDLAINFAGALGILGMSNPMYALQEIRSIMTGTIDQNSVLARSLGLTNEDVRNARSSEEGITAFLERRLEAFTVGERIASQQFAGITSNIQEIKQEASRSLGAPMLDPLLESLTVLYDRLQVVSAQILEIADGFGRIGAIGMRSLMSAAGSVPALSGFSEGDQRDAFNSINEQVAKLAVFVQSELDKIRPVIIRLLDNAVKSVQVLSTAVAGLVAQFAAFKFERFQVFLFTLTNTVQLLANTLVPTLTTILNAYTAILSTDAARWFASVNVQIEALERLGVMSFARLSYYATRVFIPTIREVWEGFEKGKEIIDRVFKVIGSVISRALTFIGGLLQTALNSAIQLFETLSIRVLTGLSKIAAAVGTTLTRVSVTLSTSTSPVLQQLALILATVAKAFQEVGRQAEVSTIKVAQFADSSKQKLQGLSNLGEQTAEAAGTLGQALKKGLGDGLVFIGKKLGGLMWGLIKFKAGLLLLQLAIGVVTDQIAKVQRAQQEIASRTRAELAVKRLSTEFKNLGDNASAAAKAMRDYERSQISNRITELRKALGEEQALFEKAAERLEAVDPDRRRARKTRSRGQGQINRDLKALERQTELTRELENLTATELKLEFDASAKEDVALMAKERQAVEDAVKEYRKQLEKELNDERFRATRELAQLEQNLREEGRRIERLELERQLTRESRELVGVRAGLAQVLSQYQLDLFDAQTQAERRQFDLVETRANLEKTIADYKLRLEEQTERIRKRIGDFNTQVADYQVAQAEREAQVRRRAAIEQARILTERFTLGPETRKEFNEAAELRDVSATRALALLKMPGVIDAMGIQPRKENFGQIIDYLKQTFPGMSLGKDASQSDFINKMNLRSSALGLPMGEAYYQAALSESKNYRFIERDIPPPPKLETFADLDTGQFAREREGLNQQLLDMRQRLNQILDVNQPAEARTRAVDALQDPARYTNIGPALAAQDALAEEQRDLEQLIKVVNAGSTYVPVATQAMAVLRTNIERVSETFIELIPELKDASVELRNRFIDALHQSLKQSISSNTPELTAELDRVLPPAYREIALAMAKGVVDAAERIKDTAPILELQRGYAALNKVIADVAETTQKALRNTLLDAMDTFGAMSSETSPLQRRRAQVERDILRQRMATEDAGGLHTGQQRQQFETEVADRLRASAESLGMFEEELKRATERLTLAKELTGDFIQGTKRIINDAITRGGDIQDAVINLLNSLRDRVMSSFLDFALRPLEQSIENVFSQIMGASSAEALEEKYRREVIIEQQKLTKGMDALRDQAEKTERELKRFNDALNRRSDEPLPSIPEPKAPTAPSAGSGLPTSRQLLDGLVGPGEIWNPGNTHGGASDEELKRRYEGLHINSAPSSSLGDQLAAMAQNEIGRLASTRAIPLKVIPSSAAGAQDPLMDLTDSTKEIVDASKGVAPKFEELQKGLAGAVTGFASLAMGLAGAQMISGGGTYEKLMGAAAIFGSIASVTSMFAPGGAFGGERARGGPVYADTPYLVGEEGPELFTPKATGSITTASRTAAIMASRNALGNSEAGSSPDSPENGTAIDHNNPVFTESRAAIDHNNPVFTESRAALQNQQLLTRERSSERLIMESLNRQPKPLDVHYEAEVINETRYVTADQFERGMSDAANRGRALTLQVLGSSVQTRRKLGMS